LSFCPYGWDFEGTDAGACFCWYGINWRSQYDLCLLVEDMSDCATLTFCEPFRVTHTCVEFLSWGYQRTSFRRYQVMRPLRPKPSSRQRAPKFMFRPCRFSRLRRFPPRITLVSILQPTTNLRIHQVSGFATKNVCSVRAAFHTMQSHPLKFFPCMQPYCLTTAIGPPDVEPLRSPNVSRDVVCKSVPDLRAFLR
jgi:hypothetical protein